MVSASVHVSWEDHSAVASRRCYAFGFGELHLGPELFSLNCNQETGSIACENGILSEFRKLYRVHCQAMHQPACVCRNLGEAQGWKLDSLFTHSHQSWSDLASSGLIFTSSFQWILNFHESPRIWLRAFWWNSTRVTLVSFYRFYNFRFSHEKVGRDCQGSVRTAAWNESSLIKSSI